jgi:N-acetylglucosaminyldiphosphoundecaprenol N-acetyl-beta-D-mannosaminyltransferase
MRSADPSFTCDRNAPIRTSRVDILGVAVDNLTEDEVVERIDGLVADGGAHHIVTVNPEFIMEAGRNPIFRGVLARADIATADGFGLLLAARYLRQPLRGRVTGVELTRRIAALAARRGYRLFLLGAAPGVAERTADVLQEAHPTLKIVGTYAGSPHPRHEPFLQQLISAADPDILLVAYGHPAQDLWIARNQPALHIPLAIGVGGTFDYLAGIVPRAPAWLRRLGLEWVYRLMQQPWRWRRILDAVPRFLWAVWRTQPRHLVPAKGVR